METRGPEDGHRRPREMGEGSKAPPADRLYSPTSRWRGSDVLLERYWRQQKLLCCKHGNCFPFGFRSWPMWETGRWDERDPTWGEVRDTDQSRVGSGSCLEADPPAFVQWKPPFKRWQLFPFQDLSIPYYLRDPSFKVLLVSLPLLPSSLASSVSSDVAVLM